MSLSKKINDNKQKKILFICLFLVISVILLFGYKTWDISSVCPKCLQHAYIHKKDVYGLPIYKSIKLRQNPGGIMSSASFSPSIPDISPKLYTEIFEKECSHEFKRGGFGFNTFGLHGDGSFCEWDFFVNRMDFIEAVYIAYSNTKSKKLAKETYRIIDTIFPVEDFEKTARMVVMLNNPQKIDFKKTAFLTPEETKIVNKALQLQQIIPKLKQVKTEEEWEKLITKINQTEI